VQNGSKVNILPNMMDFPTLYHAITCMNNVRGKTFAAQVDFVALFE